MSLLPILANTGTNVSIIFIDKANNDGKVLLMDASKLGTKVKSGKNQRTVLSDQEVKKIIDTFIGHGIVDDFSVSVTYDKIAEKNYSFSAGQYFEVKIEYANITAEQFEERIYEYKISLLEKFERGRELEKAIANQMEGLFFES